MAARKGRRGHSKRTRTGKEGAKQKKWANSKGKRIHLFLSFSALLSLEESDRGEHLGARGPQNFSVRHSHRFNPALGAALGFIICSFILEENAATLDHLCCNFSSGSSSITVPGAPPPTPPRTMQCYMCSNQRKPKCAQLGGFRAGVGAPSANTFSYLLHLSAFWRCLKETIVLNFPIFCRQTCLHIVQQIQIRGYVKVKTLQCEGSPTGAALCI